MERSGLTDYGDFRVGALEATGCSFCTRLHFGRELPGETRRYIRIAYSGIDADRIATGLSALKAFVEERAL